jgi:hypothetical protein
MNKSLRFAALTAALVVAVWVGSARTSQALQFPCNSSYPNPCTVGATATCIESWGTVRDCECVSFREQGRWLCYW